MLRVTWLVSWSRLVSSDALSFRSTVTRLVRDTEGQDLVEYALLSATFGIAAIAAAITLHDAMGVAYGRWFTDTQDLWEPPPPA